MLRIEIDMFSGRPNPVWLVTDLEEAERLLALVADSEGVASRQGTGFVGLGYRELRVSFVGDDLIRPKGVPVEFALGSTASADLRRSAELALQLVEQMPLRSRINLMEHTLTPLTSSLRDFVLEQMHKFFAKPPVLERLLPFRRNPLRTTIPDARCTDCRYEVSQYNPAFWNRAHVRPYNNCYNYARNWRTDTFAQPGRAHGAQTHIMSCPTVTAAAMADGLRKRCDCLPQSEYPRRLMALVVWPDRDYHWYRHQRGGFWGHKPGGTAARNVDNGNNLITNPETCNRGDYTDFCDYFYAGRSVVIN